MPSGLTRSKDVITYVKGCISRERERLAAAARAAGLPEAFAVAILDSAHDEQVFEWIGAGKRLYPRAKPE